MSPTLRAEAVRWVAPAKPHVAQLMEFVCCAPEPKRRPFQTWQHSTPWRLEAQKLLRNMPAPCKPPQFGLVGVDDGGIAAGAWFEIDDGVWHINAAAVALRWQRHRLGDQLMERVLSRIIEHAEEHGVQASPVTARVHPSNRESLALVDRFGFVQVREPKPEENVYPLWAMALPTRL